ncbi:MAG: lipid-A-disaccharide synthase [Bacteroidota bacterium]
MKIYLIAGEASGDLHAGNMLKALKQIRPETECRAWGGDNLTEAGATVVKHYRDLAFMGFVEVIKHLGTILRNLSFCKKDILEYNPDALVFVDYPGFNMRIARWAKKRGIRVIYYISPQIWAWRQSRVHRIKRDVDKMLVILPFEKSFYERFGMETTYVGHPLLDALMGEPRNENVSYPAKTIALLPGSRKQEIQRILPLMLSVTPFFPDYNFVVAAAKEQPDDMYAPWLRAYPNVRIVRDQTYPLLQHSVAALVKSGTSTLETALLDVPQVVCYTSNRVSYYIARLLIKVRYISLVNLIADAPIVTELIQDELNTDNIKTELEKLLHPEFASKMKENYAVLREKLGSGGASVRAAQAISDSLE